MIYTFYARNGHKKLGKVGTDAYKSALGFLVPDSIDSEDKEAISKYLKTLQRYFADNGSGVNNFIADAIQKGLMTKTEDGADIVKGTRIDDFVEKLNLTKEAVRAIFGEAETYGSKFNWNLDGLNSLDDALFEAQTKYDELRNDFEQNGLTIEVNQDDINKASNTTYTAGAGLSLSGNQFKHSNAVTAGTAKGDDSKTLGFGGTFTIPSVTYDAQGHITGKGSTTMTMPSAPTSVSGNAGSATKLANARNFSITGGATAAAVSFNGTADVALNVTSVNAAKLTIAESDTLILDHLVLVVLLIVRINWLHREK